MGKIFVHKHKDIDECDGGVGGVSAPMATLDNVGGMGNPVPPSENHPGSGDTFGPVTKLSKQKPAKPITIKHLKIKKHVQS